MIVPSKLDRQARQYRNTEPHVLLNQLNELGTSTRRERDRMQRQLMNLKLRNSLIAGLVTGIVVELLHHLLK